MRYCPSKCTENADFNTHVEGPGEYWKQWDQDGWTQPLYGKDTPQEIAAGFTQGNPAEVQAGVAVICKKPYSVCDYPQGDVFVREALERILKKTTKTQCRASMKIFLCALYRRKCQDEFDTDEASATFQHQRVYPVCFPQCKNAYKDCGFSTEYANLMCGEYIKAGWVTYDYNLNCDDPANRSTPCILLSLLASLALLFYNI